jgi:CRISPR-associated protein Cmr1
MKTLDYRIAFTAPAFLGNADQDGQWRTPPFKALLRQWWRVVYAADHGDDLSVDAMRTEEGRLFGFASDQRAGSCKSQVRLRLDHWDLGRQRDWKGLETARVVHPEVKNKAGKPVAVGAHLYLGYGPLESRQGTTALKTNAAIQAGESATLSIACPESAAPSLQEAFVLLDRYGTIGGRSRNGWGSLSVIAADANAGPAEPELPKALQRKWEDSLDRDWPHAIGTDERGPLIWRSKETFDDWKGLMRLFAELKIGLRTQFRFTTGHNAHKPEARHWLSYPVTKHSVNSWGRNARLPNSLDSSVSVESAPRRSCRTDTWQAEP